MPLITCPDCGRQHSTAAAACPQCGRVAGKAQPREGLFLRTLNVGCMVVVGFVALVVVFWVIGAAS